jgi:hypothetical protein
LLDTIRNLQGGDPIIEEARAQYRDYVPERPNDEYYYRNWPAFHAPTFLRRYIDSIKSAKILPYHEGSGRYMAWGKMVSLSIQLCSI